MALSIKEKLAILVEKRHLALEEKMADGELGQAYTYASTSQELATEYHDAFGYSLVKRGMDIFLSLLALLVLWPLMLLTAIVVFLDDPHGSPIFIQIRVGKNGKPFRFFKFRSMVVNAEEQLPALQPQNEMDGPVFKIKHDPRVTRVGRFIRRTSIDELPQLFNILKGEMSFVGPRPALPREVEQYGLYEKQRLLVKPGLTCYWQVRGRSTIGFQEWMRMDMEYVYNHNLRIDFLLVLKTIAIVIRGVGAA